MLDLNSTKAPAPVEREELFTLNGVVGRIPVEFEASAALLYADGVRKFGGETAASWALEYALMDDSLPLKRQGEAYRALINAKPHELSNDQLGLIISICIQRILGKQIAIPGPKAPAPAEAEPVEDPIYQETTSAPDWPAAETSDSSHT